MPLRLLPAAAVVLIASCAGISYTRTWASNDMVLRDRLVIDGAAFRLERSSPGGRSSFEGSLERGDGRWTFSIQRWAPSNGAPQSFDPPLVYVYEVKTFVGAVSFLKLLEVPGRSPLQFIQPGDFERSP